MFLKNKWKNLSIKKKLFLWSSLTIIIAFSLLYISMYLFMPKVYEFYKVNNINEEIKELKYELLNNEEIDIDEVLDKFSYENNLYKNQMSPYTIDLSEENTVATGGAIKIIKPNDFLWPGDYQYIKFNYEIKFKDETIKWEELKKNNLPEEAWYFHTVECTFAYCNVEGKWTNGTPLYSEWINKSEQLVPIVKKDLPSWVTEPCCFFVQIHNCDDGSWPLQVESVEIKSIQLIPYKNESTPVPTAEPV